MNSVKSLVTMIKAIAVGIVILVTLTIATAFMLEPILNVLYPPCRPTPMPEEYSLSNIHVVNLSQADCAGGIQIFGPNFGRYMVILVNLYFFYTGIASFVSGFLMKRWGRETNSYAWQSLLGGFIVGAFPFTFFPFEKGRRGVSLLLVFADRLLFGSDTITLLVCVLIGLVAGVAGYYVASRKYHQITENPNDPAKPFQ